MHNAMTYLDYLFFDTPCTVHTVKLRIKSAFTTDKYTSNMIIRGDYDVSSDQCSQTKEWDRGVTL